MTQSGNAFAAEPSNGQANSRAAAILGVSPVTRWFDTRFACPTAAQLSAWPRIAAGENTLIVSPTGTGKTLAAYLAVLHALSLRATPPGAAPGIRCLYLSPLRALGYDLSKNLLGPLRDIYPAGTHPDLPIRVASRYAMATPHPRTERVSSPIPPRSY